MNILGLGRGVSAVSSGSSGKPEVTSDGIAGWHLEINNLGLCFGRFSYAMLWGGPMLSYGVGLLVLSQGLDGVDCGGAEGGD